MSNTRVFYATKGLAIKKTGAATGSGVLPLSASGLNPSNLWEVPRGIQSVNVTTTYNLAQVFQQGEIDLYSLDEDRPDVEMTINRILDGTMPLYLIASAEPGGTNGPSNINQRNANYQCDIALEIYPDTNTRASGVPTAKMLASGIYLASVTYTFPVGGPATEEIKFSGNNKFWNVGVGGTAPNNFFPSGGVQSLIPAAEQASTNGGQNAAVTRRQHFDLVNSTLPGDIPTLDKAAIQNVTVSTDLGREEILVLGSKAPYARVVKYPIEVTCAFEVVTSNCDAGATQAVATKDNLTNRTIVLKTLQGLMIDLGTVNKLASIDLSGGDTSGGNVTIKYNYKNYNNFTISQAPYTGR